MSGEFDGAPLVAGTVRGVRRFRVDELGRLRSPQQGTVWRPGDNEARCVKQDGLALAAASISITFGGGYPVPRQPKESRPLNRPGHDVASCRCGLYAFTDGHDAAEYGGPGTVTAVVEGWGDVMVGTRGFRAPHARVLAVHIPRPAKNRWSWLRWFRMSEAARFGVVLFSGGISGLLGLVALLAVVFNWKELLPVPAPVQVTIVIGLGIALLAILSKFFDRSDTFAAEQRKALSVASVAVLRANYPDVKFYSSYAAMVSAFPPSPGEKPTPANTPDFWGRP